MAIKSSLSEADLKKLLIFTQNIRKKIIIPSQQLDNILNYQYGQITGKNIFSFCSIQKVNIKKQFKRAFKQMKKQQQIQYYAKYVKTIHNQIKNYQTLQIQLKNNNNSNQDIPNKRQTNKIQQMNILLKRKGKFQKWVKRKIKISQQFCIMSFVETGQQIDLNNYIMRISKSKDRPSLVLQCTDSLIQLTTFRISNADQPFQKLKQILEFYLEKCLKQKINKLLTKSRSTLTSSFGKTSFGRTSLRYSMDIDTFNNLYNQNSYVQFNEQRKKQPATVLLSSGQNLKSLRKTISNLNQAQFSQKDYKNMYKKIIGHDKIFGLANFKDFIEIQKDFWQNKRQNSIRKLFTFKQYQMNYEWLIMQINSYKSFKKWKNSLYLVNLLAQLPFQRTKIYHQINLYKDYTQVDYVFLRHLFQIDGVNYYLDKSINTEEYGSVNSSFSRGNIQYCLWRFRKNVYNIQLLVQISLTNIKSKNIPQIANQFIGNIYLLKQQYLKYQKVFDSSFQSIKNNLFQFQNQSELSRKKYNQNHQEISIDYSNFHQNNINKIKQKNQSQQNNQNNFNQNILNLLNRQDFSQQQQSQVNNTQFYTVIAQSFSHKDTQNQNQIQFNQNILNQVQQIQQSNNIKIKKQNNLQKSRSQKQQKQQLVTNKNKQKRYIVNPQIKQQTQKLKKAQYGHFLWRNQWKINQKGQLVNINQKQIQVQSSVLKLVLKKMGRNLLSGKSILNISLPIQIFGTDSNLQRLCKSMAYAPKYLQQACKLTDPVQRIKRVICFGIGYSLCYIQMQKPFNPIIGQTYQGIIDGCPIYGQQISHHPPISTVFLKGRGYYAYGNFQAKVDLGMNSASGINQGWMNVAFSQNNFKQNIIKFNCPPGQLSGLVYGQRKVTLIKKSYYYDENNLILAIVNFGMIKKKNQISNFNDYLDGIIVKLKKPIEDFNYIHKLKQNNYQKVLAQFKGRWTNKIIFDNIFLFDLQLQAPYQIQQEKYPLLSNVHFRQDIQLRKLQKWTQAQQAKQKIQQFQRNDRKLRKKYQKNN